MSKRRDCLRQPGKFKEFLHFWSSGFKTTETNVEKVIESKVIARVSELESAAKTNKDEIEYLKQQNDNESEGIKLQLELIKKQTKEFEELKPKPTGFSQPGFYPLSAPTSSIPLLEPK